MKWNYDNKFRNILKNTFKTLPITKESISAHCREYLVVWDWSDTDPSAKYFPI